jgi:hypothetical protein
MAAAGLLALAPANATTPDSRAADSPDPKVIQLNHKTLDFEAEGWQRFELTGSIANGAGKGKLRRTVLANPEKRNIFGDRIDEPSQDAKITEHDISLERVTYGVGNQVVLGNHQLIPDPSPSNDRTLYLVKGIDLGTARKLLVMVSANSPQRLIYLGRCGGVWATALEPCGTFDGPTKKDK